MFLNPAGATRLCPVAGLQLARPVIGERPEIARLVRGVASLAIAVIAVGMRVKNRPAAVLEPGARQARHAVVGIGDGTEVG